MSDNDKGKISSNGLILENLRVIAITNDFASNNAKIMFEDIRKVKYNVKLADNTLYSMAGSGMFALVLEAFRHSLKIKTIKTTGYIDPEQYHYLDGIEIGCD